jgi:hypothetical protein
VFLLSPLPREVIANFPSALPCEEPIKPCVRRTLVLTDERWRVEVVCLFLVVRGRKGTRKRQKSKMGLERGFSALASGETR